MRPHATIYLLGNNRDLLSPFHHFLSMDGYRIFQDGGESMDVTVSQLSGWNTNIDLLAFLQPDTHLLNTVREAQRKGFTQPVAALAEDRCGPLVLWKTRHLRISAYVSLNAGVQNWKMVLGAVPSSWCVVSERWYHGLLDLMCQETDGPLPPSALKQPAFSQLTMQEIRIAHLITSGLDNRQIAEQMQITLSTVKTHVHRILSKLNLCSRSQVRIWMKQQWEEYRFLLPQEPVEM